MSEQVQNKEVAEKKCKSCSFYRAISYFGKSYQTKDKLQPYCDICRRAYSQFSRNYERALKRGVIIAEKVKYRRTLERPITWVENWGPARIAMLDSPCHECTSHKPVTGGYPYIRRNGINTNVHRFLYMQRTGIELPKSIVIRHRCDNRLCINQEHLIPGTHADNMQDMIVRKRNKPIRGEKNHKAVLTNDLAEEIFSRRGESIAKLAREYNVSVGCITGVVKNTTWRHINVV